MARKPVVSRHIEVWNLQAYENGKYLYHETSCDYDTIKELEIRAKSKGFETKIEKKTFLFSMPVLTFVKLGHFLDPKLYSNRRINHNFINATITYYNVKMHDCVLGDRYEVKLSLDKNINKIMEENFPNYDYFYELIKERYYMDYETYIRNADICDEKTRRPIKEKGE